MVFGRTFGKTLPERFQAFLHRSDWLLTATVLLLMSIGCIAIWSFSPPGQNFLGKQLIWAALGLATFFFFAIFDFRIFRNHGYLLMAFYIVMIAALAILLFLGPVTRGVRGWFELGSAKIQPVELMKLVLVLVLAKYFSRRHIEIARFRHLIISGMYVGIAALLVLVQPDLGSAMILVAIWLAVVVFSGIKLRHFVLFILLAAILAVFAWGAVLEPYQKARIMTFIDPYRDSRGAGYNTIQSMIAVGSGRVWGKGIGYGTQSHLQFLPEAETDFVFAGLAEENGFLGTTILLLLFAVLFWRILKIGIHARDNFSRLYVLGFASFVFFEMFIHAAISMAILPVTGIVLPLISYGGSSLIATLAGLGILQSIRIHSAEEGGSAY